MNIDKIYYINLKQRKDRLNHVRKQLVNVGLIDQAERFEAIKISSGAVGCTMSHIKCLEKAKENNYNSVMIVEDDICFEDNEQFKKSLDTILKLKFKWDVCLLGGNTLPPIVKINSSCARTFYTQTTTGYIVQKHYYNTLINNMKEGVIKLMQEPTNKTHFAVDRYWLQLQKNDYWILLMPQIVSQLPDYSDVEEKEIDYTELFHRQLT